MPVHFLSELIRFNENHKETTLKYGQDKLESRIKLPDPLRAPEYIQAKLEDIYFSQQGVIDYALKKYNLGRKPSSFVYLFNYLCKSRLSSIVLPAEYIENGRPFGIALGAFAFSEGPLIMLGYTYEQHTKLRRSPYFEKEIQQNS